MLRLELHCCHLKTGPVVKHLVCHYFGSAAAYLKIAYVIQGEILQSITILRTNANLHVYSVLYFQFGR